MPINTYTYITEAFSFEVLLSKRTSGYIPEHKREN